MKYNKLGFISSVLAFVLCLNLFTFFMSRYFIKKYNDMEWERATEKCNGVVTNLENNLEKITFLGNYDAVPVFMESFSAHYADQKISFELWDGKEKIYSNMPKKMNSQQNKSSGFQKFGGITYLVLDDEINCEFSPKEEGKVYRVTCAVDVSGYDKDLGRMIMLSHGIVILVSVLYTVWAYRTFKAQSGIVEYTTGAIDKLASGEISPKDFKISERKYKNIGKSFENLCNKVSEMTEKAENDMESAQKTVGIVSNQLIDPLDEMGRVCQRALGGDLDEKTRKDLEFVYRELGSLSEISAKLAEVMSFNAEDFSTRELRADPMLDDVAYRMSRRAANVGVRAEVLHSMTILRGDEALLVSLLSCLFEISLAACTSGCTVSMGFNGAYFIISNDGRGIGEETAKKLENMINGGKFEKNVYPVSAIDIDMCQKILALHKARVEISSEEGYGVTVKVLFDKEEKGA